MFTHLYDFLWPPPLEVHDLSGLENNIMEFHDFPSVPWPVQTQ